MGIQRFIIAMLALSVCIITNAIARSDDNPFEKGINVDIGGAGWVVKDKSATLSGSDSDDYYHLMYDRKQLRLRITGSAEDSDASARSFNQFAVNDVLVDGKRLPVFQWCLNNQQKHSRFLQQGFSVKNDICINQGVAGSFYMRLNQATLELLQQGETLTFSIKPFRTKLDINFDISGFSAMATQLATPAVKKTAKAKAVPIIVPAAASKAVSMCQAKAPAGYAEVKPIDYACDDAVAKSMAESNIGALVKKEQERRDKAAAERERKRLAEEAARKKELEAQKAAEAARAAEQAAIAASLAQQKAISDEIANKMLGVCKKKWAKGEHRCYCEKYLEHAPAGIKSDPSCG